MANGMDDYEQAIAPVKRDMLTNQLAQQAAGATADRPHRLLEIGIGTGPNFGYYADARAQLRDRGALRITGIDPNTAMQAYALENAAKHGMDDVFTPMVGSVEELPFEDEYFDTVVCTLVSGRAR